MFYSTKYFNRNHSYNHIKSRTYSKMIGNSGGSNYMMQSKESNKKIIPVKNYLKEITIAPKIDTNLEVEHSIFKIADDKYIVDLNMGVQNSMSDLKPSTYVFCIDISGSMNSRCTYDDSDPEMSKFSRLDMIKHTLRTAVYCLRPIDKIAIIGFSDGVSKCLDMTNMDTNGKKTALKQIDNLCAYGSTHLWAGLDASINIVDQIDDTSNIHILLLTDGLPNVMQHSILNNLYNKLGDNLPKHTIHTFGYGYELDSRLLLDISQRCGGMFGHIPDQTMCNTIILNFLANTLITSINNTSITMNNLYGCNNVTTNYHQTNPNTIITGAIQPEQKRHIPILIETNDINNLQMEFNIDYYTNNTLYKYPHVIKGKNSQIIEPNIICYLEKLKSIIKSSQVHGQTKSNKQVLNELEKFYDMLANMNQNTKNKEIKNLLTNIQSPHTTEGQLCKAFSNDEWFKRWGVHYLLAHFRAHELQLRINFKDTALTNYGGKLFDDVLHEVEQIFFDIVPIPKPSLATSNQPFTGNYHTSTYSSSGPCVDGYGKVNTTEGKKLVKDLKKGDIVINSNGNRVTIVCVIKTRVHRKQAKMVKINNLVITPYHPIKINDRWIFPCNHHQYRKHINFCNTVYNFVVSGDHMITINDIDVITLGHGLNDNSVVRHPFLGTEKVINHLKMHHGWNKGLIVTNDYSVRRNNKLICGLY